MSGAWTPVWAIARKELRAYFGSPLALIFIGVFLAATLFLFFWAETFFARNIADVRPLFRWMPVLMILLVATLTMRQWSEEQRAGTLEMLLTLPVSTVHLALGKFLAVVILLATALVLTLSIPVTVELLGDLDWGPAIGGYLGVLLLGSAYAAIGLFVSSRTDNQIVSLILTVLIGGLLYLVGTETVTVFVGGGASEILRAIGSGSRFESIERGVIDVRDVIYYGSVASLFLALNVVSLETKRWSKGADAAPMRRGAIVVAILIAANLLVLNVWLFPLSGMRVDLTAQREYSLTAPTMDVISNLQEPLLLRGYISDRTHPLLEPLIPTIRDLLREYEIASRGRIEAEVVDPRTDEDIEGEANRSYGIESTPFAITERRDSSVVNSYFDILVRYGDQFVVLNFADLVEVDQSGSDLTVRLRNLEYDLTSAIKKAVSGFQRQDAVFASLEEPLLLTAYITEATLPEALKDAPANFRAVAGQLAAESNGKLVVSVVDPDLPDSPLTREQIQQTQGIAPSLVALGSTDSYYFHMVLTRGPDSILVYPGGEATAADIRSAIDAGIRRVVPGLLKSIGLWVPPDDPVPGFFGQDVPPISSWSYVHQQLSQNYNMVLADLSQGTAPDVDVLVIVSPRNMAPKEVLAIDQFLMRGGSVIVASGSFIVSPIQMGTGIGLEEVKGGLGDMLASYGVGIGKEMVLDTQNEQFPIQVRRNVGGVNVLDIERISYPPFVDIRRDGMDTDSPVTANMPAVTLQWASPLLIDGSMASGRDVNVFLRSTRKSWLRASADVDPDREEYPVLGFPVEGDQRSYPLAVSIRGSFKSYFSDRPSPFEDDPLGRSGPGLVDQSPESTRLIVFGSSEFLDDIILDLSRSISADRYLFNLQFLENAVDWALEDEDLLGLRARGTYTRLLQPLEESEQTIWEAANYLVALTALLILGLVWNVRQRGEPAMALVDPSDEGEDQDDD